MIRSIRSGLALSVLTGRAVSIRCYRLVVWRERGAPMTPRSPTRILARHCDRYVVTLASPIRPCDVRFSKGRCILRRTTEPVRPADRDSTSAPGSLGPGFFARPRIPDRRCGRPPHARPADQRAPEEHRDLRSIGPSPVSTVASSSSTPPPIRSTTSRRASPRDPKRCTSCRASRRAARDGGDDVRDIGGPRGYERGVERPDREYFAVVCSSCGNQAQVPFRPRMDRPVYCSDCFRTVRPD